MPQAIEMNLKWRENKLSLTGVKMKGIQNETARGGLEFCLRGEQ